MSPSLYLSRVLFQLSIKKGSVKRKKESGGEVLFSLCVSLSLSLPSFTHPYLEQNWIGRSKKKIFLSLVGRFFAIVFSTVIFHFSYPLVSSMFSNLYAARKVGERKSLLH